MKEESPNFAQKEGSILSLTTQQKLNNAVKNIGLCQNDSFLTKAVY